MAADGLTAGTVLDGTYELSAQLGAGGMGVVWRAKHLRLPKEVAVKVLRGVLGDDPDAYARFRREAEIASQLGHPNIVEALDFNVLPDGTPYLVLELLRGCSLRQLVVQGPLPLERALVIASQIAAGLRAAHRREIVHRDLKPENVFLCQQEQEDAIQVKVLDFGISKMHSSQSLKTREGVLMGTPHYMAPEQAVGGEVDARTDQFALAAIIYEMLTGKAPFFAEQPLQVLYQVVHSEPLPASRQRRGLPVAVDAVLLRALSKQPGERFEDVAELVHQLWRASGLAVPREALALLSSSTNDGLAAVPGPGTAPAIASEPRRAEDVLGNAPTIDSGRVLTGPTRWPSVSHTGPQPRTPAEAAVLANAPTITQRPALDGQTGPLGAAPRASVRGLGLVVVVALLASVAGGGLVYWLSRAKAPVAVARRAVDAGSPPRRGGRELKRNPYLEKSRSDARRPPSDLAANHGRSADQQPGSKPQPPGTKPPGTKPPGTKPPGTKPPGTKPPGKKPRPLSQALRARLAEAERLLSRRDFKNAIVQAERLLRDLPDDAKWRARRLLTLGYCGAQELTNAIANFRNLPRGAVRRSTRARCRAYGTDFVSD